MFFVINKSKLFSYLIAVGTVLILFVVSASFGTHNEETITTSNGTKELPIYQVETEEKQIALTMNCAWNDDDIPLILDTLAKHKINITFFVVGDWIDKFPETVKKIYEAGHEIGNHSDTHPHVNNISEEKNREQIRNCSQKVEKITGKRTNLYRGPYGEYNNTVIRAAKAENHISIQWNLDTLDYKGLTGEQMWERIGGKLNNGSIILMHNGTTHTAESLDDLLYKIEEKGFKIVTVSELIYNDNYQIDSTGTQRKISE